MSEKQKYEAWFKQAQEERGLIDVSVTITEEITNTEDLYRAMNEFNEKMDTTEPRIEVTFL